MRTRLRPSAATPVIRAEVNEREGLRGREVKRGPWSPATTSPTCAAAASPDAPSVAAIWSMLDAGVESRAPPKTSREGPAAPTESPASATAAEGPARREKRP